MPVLRAVSHISLSVRDLDTSRRWYQEVLGLEQLVPPFEREAYRETMLRLPNGTALCLQAHHANNAEPFDESRTGLDHIAFLVPTYDELDAWSARLDQKGIPHSDYPIGTHGRVVVFRDPDNIQLELHCLPPRAPALATNQEP